MVKSRNKNACRCTRMGAEMKFGKKKADPIFDIVNMVVMSILLIVFLWPLIFVISASLSDPGAVWNGEVIFFPVRFNLNAYKEILGYKDIWIGYRNTLFYTIAGTALNLCFTVFAAYPLSRKDFYTRNFFMFLFMFTMYFSGGLIPTYMVVSGLGLTNTFWAMIVPGAVSVYNMIITRTYFVNSIPESLQEAAQLDGANTFQFLIRIVLPLSKPILAVIGLYYGVAHWNDFFTALLYVNDKALFPLQTFLRDILIQNNLALDAAGLDPTDAAAKMQLAQTIKYGVIVVASVPVLCIYPFIQKYFVKGIMIGAVKG